MGAIKSRMKGGGGGQKGQPINLNNLKYDPDERWQNLYRERGKNHLYKWVGVNDGGEMVELFREKGEEALLSFAAEYIESMLYNDGLKPEVLKLAEFMKWKRSVTTNLSGKDDAAVDSSDDEAERRFIEHEAQWRLNKRGIEGETVVHLLLSRDEPICTHMARTLIKAYPALVNDMFMGDDMFGETVLHQAIVNDDYDLVGLVVEMEANVNARATGRFFRPEDQKGRNPPKITDYVGYAYFGEYPLAFAACFGNKDIYDMLIKNGADPNRKDSYGNTVLHMCVIHYCRDMYTYAVRHWGKSADVNIVNDAGYTPLTLAAKLGRKDIFEEMLELTKSEFWRFSDMTCSAYPLTALDTIRSDGTTNWDSALMTIINGNTIGHLDMIGTEVIQRLLHDKWKAYGMRKIAERGVFTFAHLLAMCFAVYARPEPYSTKDDEMTKVLNAETGHSEVVPLLVPSSLAGLEGWLGVIRVIAEVCVCIGCLIFVGQQQLAEIRMQGVRGYLQSLKTAPDKAVFLLANICILGVIPLRITLAIVNSMHEPTKDDTIIHSLFDNATEAFNSTKPGPLASNADSAIIWPDLLADLEELLLCFAVPGSWFFLLFFARALFLTGPFVQMIYSMIAGDILRFGIIAGIIITSFSQAFYFMGKDASYYTYETFIETFVTLFRMSMGGYDYEEFANVHYEQLTKVLFVVYMISMPIMMINMLIAMMGNTYTTVVSQAEKAWRQQWARIIMVLERTVHQKQLAQAQLEYSYKLVDQRELKFGITNTDPSQERRGLVVIKQTKKTRAKQRKQAVDNWKKISRRVISAYYEHGVDKSRKQLHQHRQFSIDLNEFNAAHRPKSSALHLIEGIEREVNEIDLLEFRQKYRKFTNRDPWASIWGKVRYRTEKVKLLHGGSLAQSALMSAYNARSRPRTGRRDSMYPASRAQVQVHAPMNAVDLLDLSMPSKDQPQQVLSVESLAARQHLLQELLPSQIFSESMNTSQVPAQPKRVTPPPFAAPLPPPPPLPATYNRPRRPVPIPANQQPLDIAAPNVPGLPSLPQTTGGLRNRSRQRPAAGVLPNIHQSTQAQHDDQSKSSDTTE